MSDWGVRRAHLEQKLGELERGLTEAEKTVPTTQWLLESLREVLGVTQRQQVAIATLQRQMTSHPEALAGAEGPLDQMEQGPIA